MPRTFEIVFIKKYILKQGELPKIPLHTTINKEMSRRKVDL